MNLIYKLSIIILVAATPIISNANATATGSPLQTITRIKGEGFRKCKAMKSSQIRYWRGTVRGKVVSFSRNGDFKSFSLATCFETNASCKKWINRIEHIIPSIEEISSRKCKQKH